MYPRKQRAAVTRPQNATALNDNLPCLYSIVRKPHRNGTALVLYEARQQTRDWQPIKRIVLDTELHAAAALRAIRVCGIDCLI